MAVSRDDIRRLFGDISDHIVAEIQESGASMAELQEVAAHLAEETDVMGEMERPLTGTALRLYTMLRRVDEAWEEDR